MFRKQILISLLFSASIAHANIFAQWGITSSTRETPDRSEVKFVEFGKAGEEGKLAYTLGVGGWSDNTHYGKQALKTKAPNDGVVHVDLPDNPFASQEAQSSAFVEALFGVEPKSDHFYMSYKLGPALITNPDAMLGSNIQCGHEFGLGMRDARDVRIGLVIKHFSNAGIVRPNLGRDFVGLRIEF